jgi:hypothetical protein
MNDDPAKQNGAHEISRAGLQRKGFKRPKVPE